MRVTSSNLFYKLAFVSLLPDVIRSVSDAHLAEIVCASAKRDSVSHLKTNGHLFAIFSASGTVHTPHVDPNGVGTMLYVHEGYKLLLVAAFKGDLRTLPEFPTKLGAEGLWEILETEGLEFSVFVLGPNDAG